MDYGGRKMNISRDLALTIIRYLINNPDFYFPFIIKCKEPGKNNYFEISINKIGLNKILSSKELNEFILIENLQNLFKETIELMAKGFIDKITNENYINEIEKLSKEYRKKWKKELCESEDIEIFGENEFIGGKADAFEECLKLLKSK